MPLSSRPPKRPRPRGMCYVPQESMEGTEGLGDRGAMGLVGLLVPGIT